MRSSSIAALTQVSRYDGALMMCLCLLSLATACIPSNPAAPNETRAERLHVGAYYLRTVDGAGLPAAVPGGLRIESGFLVADSTNPGVVGFGESVGRDRSASMRLATGSARVVGQDYRDGRIAQVTWQGDAAPARADSVLWSADSVIVYRTGTAPSVAGAGHRLIYTRATPADTL